MLGLLEVEKGFSTKIITSEDSNATTVTITVFPVDRISLNQNFIVQDCVVKLRLR